MGRYELFDAGTRHCKYPGLSIRVSSTGRKVFALLYRRNGKLKRATLGVFPILGLHDARVTALDIIRDSQADPAERKRLRRKSPTFAELAREFQRRYIESDHIRPATAANYGRYLARLVKHFGSMKATDLTRELVEDFRDEHLSAPVGTNRQLELISRVYSWALEDRELRRFVEKNPSHGVKPLPENPVSRVLRREELRTVLLAANDLIPRWRDALWWLALHGCRPADVYLRGARGRGISWLDIDVPTREWSLPVTKTEPRIVPLTQAALAVLERVKVYNGADPVFHLRWDALTASLRKATGLDFSPKDLRTTCATEMQRLGVLPDIIDRVQGRRPWGPAVRARYQKHAYLPEQREALEKWQGFLVSLVA